MLALPHAGRGLGLLSLALLLAASTASAQIPKKFTNLQVLPKDIDPQELTSTMRGFASALGVRCNFCHVGGTRDSLDEMDFASDESPHKKVARDMLKMVRTINGDLLPKADDPHEDTPRVECMTCHRGQEMPWLTSDVLEKAYADGGLDSLKSKYDALREKYYGTHTYDFSPALLAGIADSWIRAGSLDDAKALLEFNLRDNPDSWYTYALLGQVAAERDDKEAAIEAFEKALKLEPDSDWLKRTLARLKG